MIERDAAPLQESEGPLREGEILPEKFRRAVTRSRADQCYWCDEPFVEPKRKRFVIMDCHSDDPNPWGLRSICFDCFKWGGRADSSGGLDLERATRECEGCGEPVSIPTGDFCGTFRWFRWGVCSMRCYQRAYRKRRRRGGGSTIRLETGRSASPSL